MIMCVKLNKLFDREIKLYYVRQVLQQAININTMCSNVYIREIRSLSKRVGQDRNGHQKSCLLIVGHCYYILFNAT